MIADGGPTTVVERLHWPIPGLELSLRLQDGTRINIVPNEHFEHFYEAYILRPAGRFDLIAAGSVGQAESQARRHVWRTDHAQPDYVAERVVG